MSRGLLIVTRDPLAPELREKLKTALDRLTPDNIPPRPANVNSEDEHHLLVTSGHTDFIDATGARADAIASRTIWWAKTNDRFVVSTSQRAIAMALESFDPNRTAFAWMLSSGSLGPGHAWDHRVRPLGAGGRVRLDRATFEVTHQDEAIVFSLDHRTDAEHERALKQTLEEIFADLKFDPARWIVPLSGGFDSRAVLLLSKKKYPTITWGTRRALDDPRTDAGVAREVARALELEHRYFEIDLVSEPIEKIFDRYLTAGEGRLDHFVGYLDGFAVWKQLKESGVEGIVRGDEGFGWVPVASMMDAKHCVGLAALSDYAGAPTLIELGLGDVAQILPPSLQPKPGESAPAWRDRLYHGFRIPAVLGALTDLKTSYVEIANPFLSRPLLELARTQPDHLRTGKVLFKKIVTALGPPIPFATLPATIDPEDVLAGERVTAMLRDVLASRRTRELLSPKIAEFLAAPGLALKKRIASTLKRQAKSLLPTQVRRMLRNTVAPHHLDRTSVAFRAFIIVRMVETLERDALASSRSER